MPREDAAPLAINDQSKQYLESIRNQRKALDCFSCNYIAQLLLWGEFNLYILANMSVLKRVRDGFKGAAAAGALMVMPAAANAQEARVIPVEATGTNPEGKICNAVEAPGYPRGACGSPGFERPMTRDEILASEDLGGNQMVLHFGPGPRGVALEAETLTRRGRTTTAIPGGPEGGFFLIIDDFVFEDHLFDEASIADGSFAVTAEHLFDKVMKYKADQEKNRQQEEEPRQLADASAAP